MAPLLVSMRPIEDAAGAVFAYQVCVNGAYVGAAVLAEITGRWIAVCGGKRVSASSLTTVESAVIAVLDASGAILWEGLELS